MVKIYFSAFFELPLLNYGVFVYNVDIWTFKQDRMTLIYN